MISITSDDSNIPAPRLVFHYKQLADQVRALIDRAQPRDIITLGSGTYDFSPNQLRILSQVKIRGAGPGTKLMTNWVASAYYGTCFETAMNGITLEDLTLQSTCGISEQDEVIGFGGSTSTDPSKPSLEVSNSILTLNRVTVLGRAWCLYAWSGPNNTVNATDCVFVGGRWVIANCRSASGVENTFNLTGCTINVDASLSTHTGLQGLRAAGVVARGGKTFLDRCIINVKGDPTLDLCGGIWIDRMDADGKGAHPQTSIDVRRTSVRVNGNGAKEVFDLGMQTGTITVDKTSTGSNADGSFTYQAAP